MKRGSVSWGKAAEDPSAFTIRRIRQLMQLCHPDKHNGSPLSSEVFMWLQECKMRLDLKQPNKIA